MENKCLKCRWFDPVGDNYLGECRVEPPKLNPYATEDELKGVWPFVTEDDWCSQHEPKSQVAAPEPAR